eukprot:280338_1
MNGFITKLLIYLYATTASFNAQWNLVTSPQIPNSNRARAVGYDAETQLVWLLGGGDSHNQVLSFNVSSKNYMQYADFPFGGYHTAGQNYVQKDNSLWVVMGAWWYSTTGSQLYRYDMSTMVTQELSSLPTTGGERGCFTYIDNHLILLLSSELWTYDINLDTWVIIYPSTSISRIAHACQISSANYLYVVGGVGTNRDMVYKLYVGDIMNINNYGWIQLNGRISATREIGFSVIHNDLIYYIGGRDQWSRIVDIIDTTNDDIYTGTGLLYEAIKEHSSVVIEDTIYIFGGLNEDWNRQTYYQYYQIPIQLASIKPSQTPTESPIHKICTPQELDWNKLNAEDSLHLSSPIISSSWDETRLELNIDITLDYITRSKYTFIDQYDNDRGITYVIDTQPFLSDG